MSARCDGDSLKVELRVKGKVVGDDDPLTLVTSDFLASGGDGVIGRLKLPAGSVTVTDQIIRDAMATQLRRGGTLEPGKLYDAKAPRLRYDGARPVRCGKADAATEEVED